MVKKRKNNKKKWILYIFLIGIAAWAFFIATYGLIQGLIKWAVISLKPDFLDIGVDYLIVIILLLVIRVIYGKKSFKRGTQELLTK